MAQVRIFRISTHFSCFASHSQDLHFYLSQIQHTIKRLSGPGMNGSEGMCSFIPLPVTWGTSPFNFASKWTHISSITTDSCRLFCLLSRDDWQWCMSACSHVFKCRMSSGPQPYKAQMEIGNQIILHQVPGCQQTQCCWVTGTESLCKPGTVWMKVLKRILTGQCGAWINDFTGKTPRGTTPKLTHMKICNANVSF